jgi:gliding motility-associated-like protein
MSLYTINCSKDMSLVISKPSKLEDFCILLADFPLKGEQVKKLYFVIPLLSCLLFFKAQGQDCLSPGPLCPDEAAVYSTLINNPVLFNCMNVDQAYFYSFQSNNVATPGDVTISINPSNCPGSVGPDSVVAMVVNVPLGLNPCATTNWLNPSSCFADTVAFSFDVDLSASGSQYFLIVGSDHNSANGPCGIEVSINGDGVDIFASVEPIQISLGESAQLGVEGADPGAIYNWSPNQWLDNSTIPNPVTTPQETTTYVVSSTINGCEVNDVVTITVGPPITIYNAFTPNGDGHNDVWVLDGIERFENTSVAVYDRWGQQVFRSLGYATPWDGTNKGKYLPTGTYYYVIELNSLDVEIPPINGAVAIIH